MHYDSHEACKAEGGVSYSSRVMAEEEWARRYNKKAEKDRLKKWSKRKKSRNRTSCNSSTLNAHQRWQCMSLKCMQHQLILSLAGGNTNGWMAKCMALSGNSWPASGSKSSCTGPYCRNESAWDYLPGSGQWRCRDTGGARGGEFVPSSECSLQQQVDNWP